MTLWGFMLFRGRFWRLGDVWMLKLSWGFYCMRRYEHVDLFRFQFGLDLDFMRFLE